MTLYLSGLPKPSDLKTKWVNLYGVLTLQASHEPGADFARHVKEACMFSWCHAYTIKRSRDKNLTPVMWLNFNRDLDDIALKVAEGKPILIHCAAGIHRTGCNGWAVLRRLGFTEDDAIAEVIKLRPEAADFVRFLPWAKEFLLK